MSQFYCPRCGSELVASKKTKGKYLCYNCKLRVDESTLVTLSHAEKSADIPQAKEDKPSICLSDGQEILREMMRSFGAEVAADAMGDASEKDNVEDVAEIKNGVQEARVATKIPKTLVSFSSFAKDKLSAFRSSANNESKRDLPQTENGDDELIPKQEDFDDVSEAQIDELDDELIEEAKDLNPEERHHFPKVLPAKYHPSEPVKTSFTPKDSSTFKIALATSITAIVLIAIVFVSVNIVMNNRAQQNGNESNKSVTDTIISLLPGSNTSSDDNSYNTEKSNFDEAEAIKRLEEARGGHTQDEKIKDAERLAELRDAKENAERIKAEEEARLKEIEENARAEEEARSVENVSGDTNTADEPIEVNASSSTVAENRTVGSRR